MQVLAPQHLSPSRLLFSPRKIATWPAMEAVASPIPFLLSQQDLLKKSAEFPLKKDRFYFTFVIFKVGTTTGVNTPSSPAQ
jgi:hypothetical protein